MVNAKTIGLVPTRSYAKSAFDVRMVKDNFRVIRYFKRHLGARQVIFPFYTLKCTSKVQRKTVFRLPQNNVSTILLFLCTVFYHNIIYLLVSFCNMQVSIYQIVIAKSHTAVDVQRSHIHRQLRDTLGDRSQCIELIQRQGCAVFHGLGGGSILSPIALRLFGNAGRFRGRLLGVAICQCCRADRNCHGQR